MKTMAYSNPELQEVLQLQEVARPAPKDHEVLIKIHATTAMVTDFGTGRSKESGVFGSLHPSRPAIVIPGQDLAGEVEAVGRKVSRFRKGDQIVAWSGLRLGAYAEYICLPERGTLFTKPANMTYEEAATLPVGGLDAVYLLRRANIQRGERVLVNGAGGSMGTYAVQVAKHFGAEVTGVDSTAKLKMLRSIGADHVIDYIQKDFTQGRTLLAKYTCHNGDCESATCRSVRRLGHVTQIAIQPGDSRRNSAGGAGSVSTRNSLDASAR